MSNLGSQQQENGVQSVRFVADWTEQHSRLTTFFRLLLVLPQAIVGFFYVIAVFFTVVLAWFALLITGKYPSGLYKFHVGYVRWNARVAGYLYLLTDAYPSFGLGEEPNYPIRFEIGEPLPKYSRILVLFRAFLLIPVYIISYFMGLIAYVMAFVAWIVIVITGKLPEGIHDGIKLGLSYSHRATAYWLLVTEDFPAFTD